MPLSRPAPTTRRPNTSKTTSLSGELPTAYGEHPVLGSYAFIIRIADEKAIVVGIVDGVADVDFAPAELQAAYFCQFVAVIDAFILGIVFVFAVATWGRNHVSPRLLMGLGLNACGE
jgi:hypothetical protein